MEALSQSWNQNSTNGEKKDQWTCWRREPTSVLKMYFMSHVYLFIKDLYSTLYINNCVILRVWKYFNKIAVCFRYLPAGPREYGWWQNGAGREQITVSIYIYLEKGRKSMKIRKRIRLRRKKQAEAEHINLSNNFVGLFSGTHETRKYHKEKRIWLLHPINGMSASQIS